MLVGSYAALAALHAALGTHLLLSSNPVPCPPHWVAQKDVHASTLLSHMYRGNDCRRKCQSEQLADVL